MLRKTSVTVYCAVLVLARVLCLVVAVVHPGTSTPFCNHHTDLCFPVNYIYTSVQSLLIENNMSIPTSHLQPLAPFNPDEEPSALTVLGGKNG